jgi:O-antigen/teichoic acid export membrane protein
MVSGYFFWFVMSNISSPETIGVSSAVVSLATIFGTIASLGIPTGLQRFLGKVFSENKMSDAKVFVNASLVLTFAGVVACTIAILMARDWVYTTFRIDFVLLFISLLLISSNVLAGLLRSVVISSLKTRILPITMIVSATAKVILSVVMVLIGTGAIGVTIGFTVAPLMSSFIFAFVIITSLKSASSKSEVGLRGSLKDIFVSSGATWVPTIIYTIGSHLGTLLVFRSHGASQAGVYFIAFSLITALMALMSALYSIAYPTLSGMSDGRKRFAWRAINISLILSVPLACTLMFYSKQVLRLFGEEYTSGFLSLDILLLSTLPVAIASGINTLVYSYGNYRQVLAIGLASNVPRAVLYFILVPLLDNTGAALSYTLGSVSGFALSVLIAKKAKMQLHWRNILLIFTIPTAIAYVLSLTQLNYIAAVTLTMVGTYLTLIKLQVLTKSDIQDSFEILPPFILKPILTIFKLVRSNRKN